MHHAPLIQAGPALRARWPIVFGLLAACTGPGQDSAPPSTGSDTGIVQGYFVASFSTLDGEYVDADFGVAYRGLASEETECEVRGTLPYGGAAPDGCPGCAWSFDLGAITRSTAAGELCSDLGLFDGSIDTAFDYAWGFTDVYYYDYNGLPLPLADTVLLYIGGWFPFAFNYGPGTDWVEGDATYADVQRPMFTGSGEYVYYYYYL